MPENVAVVKLWRALKSMLVAFQMMIYRGVGSNHLTKQSKLANVAKSLRLYWRAKRGGWVVSNIGGLYLES